MNTSTLTAQTLAQMDRDHLWHPFTPMKQWREQRPLIIQRASQEYLIDTDGHRYIDGVSSLWCNVHGHHVPEIDKAITDQLTQVAHTTLLGLASPPSIELAAQLAKRTPNKLNKVFYSDAGATAVEVAFKMAVGYWYHQGKPQKTRFIGVQGAYHGDTVGSMSVGFSDLFHRPFASMVFPTYFAASPDACRMPKLIAAQYENQWEKYWPSEDPKLTKAIRTYCLDEMEKLLKAHAHETAAIVIEPIMQGAAGMICQPAGYLKAVSALAKKYDTLLIADEVATGFGRTGTMFACENEQVAPDIICLAKGITGGYLPLAATVCTDAIEQAFCGELSEKRTLYHGHTYTGNALACAAALASLQLFDDRHLLTHIQSSAQIIKEALQPLRACHNVLDIRQRGLMVGIELCQNRRHHEAFDFSKRTAASLCLAMREKGLLIRPLGDILVLMPIPAMRHEVLNIMLKTITQTILQWRF